MTIVKRLKNSNLPPIRKKPFLNSVKELIPAILLASLVGTYLDLYFIGKGYYSFPKRPFPNIFSINILFTLIGLPLLISGFLYLCNVIKLWLKVWVIIILSLFMSIIEKHSEALGYFIHSHSWKHHYSFIGYTVYLALIYLFYLWYKKK
ncbi:CBO0543 family protein [Heyndrickxia sporothermodurans]